MYRIIFRVAFFLPFFQATHQRLFAMRNLLFIAALIISLPVLNSQQTHFVNHAALGGQQNGTSWADAFLDLQAALAAAGNGDEIWVATGTYYPTNATDRSLSFELKRGVKIFGGFDGTEVATAQREPTHNEFF